MKVQEKLKTQVMEKEVNVKQMVRRYLLNSEKHLFQVKYSSDSEYSDNVYYKIIPVTLNDKQHYIKVNISGNKLKAIIVDTSYVETKEGLGFMKNYAFPQYKKHKSVRQYVGEFRKRLSDVFYDIKKMAEDNQNLSRKEIEDLINNKDFKL